jgi:hypothetical protein
MVLPMVGEPGLYPGLAGCARPSQPAGPIHFGSSPHALRQILCPIAALGQPHRDGAGPAAGQRPSTRRGADGDVVRPRRDGQPDHHRRHVTLAQHPDRVSHLVLLSGTTHGLMHRQVKPEVLALHEARLPLIELGRGRKDPGVQQMFTSRFMPDANAAHTSLFNAHQRMSCKGVRAAAILRACAHPGAAQRRRSGHAPVLGARTCGHHSECPFRGPSRAGRAA